ncbi:MAG: metallophosphoesterase [Nitrosopumilaceae archaeon]|nr:metallophosphoesterase [Nitrosopumilaceae archaeon]
MKFNKNIISVRSNVTQNVVNFRKYNVYAIGDVHGCIDEFDMLVQKCRDHAEKDGKESVIISLGDLIDRGPAFVEIFDYINMNNINCIMGNHEYNFWLEELGAIDCKSKARRKNHEIFKECSESYQEMIMKTLTGMTNCIVIITEHHSTFHVCVLSHAPLRNVEYGEKSFRYTNPECSMRSEPVDTYTMNSNNDKILFVHGHQSWNFKPISDQLHDQIDNDSKIINVDSGVVHGNELTALCLNNLESLTVKAKRTYFDH